MNYLLKLCHNSIKFWLLQKRSISFSWIRLVQKSIGKNNSNTQWCKCFVSNTSFSTCIYSIYVKRPVKNYKTLHGPVFLEKLLERATKRQVEGTISRLLLQEFTYRMLSLLPTMQGLFQYHQCYWVKPYHICRFFSL